MSAIPGLAAPGLQKPSLEYAAGLSWNCYGLGCSLHYFLKGVEAGLQITRAKLFHTLHHTERNRTVVPWPQVMWHRWGWGNWIPKIFSTVMNLRGQKVPKWIQSSLCCLLGIFLRAAPNAALLPFTWLRHHCWTFNPCPPSLSRARLWVGVTICGVMLSPLLMFNQLAALHWWYQNCYWCQHPGQCYFWTDLHLLDPDGDRTEQSYTWLDIFWSLRGGILLPS